MRKEIKFLPVLALLLLFGCSKYTEIEQSETRDYGKFIVIEKNDANHIIFVDPSDPNRSTKARSIIGTNPDYEFSPEQHIFDGTAEAQCHANPGEEAVFIKIDIEDSQIGYKVYTGEVASETVWGKRTYFYNTSSYPTWKAYLDCWCEHDPVETVKKLN